MANKTYLYINVGTILFNLLPLTKLSYYIRVSITPIFFLSLGNFYILNAIFVTKNIEAELIFTSLKFELSRFDCNKK